MGKGRVLGRATDNRVVKEGDQAAAEHDHTGA